MGFNYFKNRKDSSDKMIARLAFREFRHNNGLWTKKYTIAQKKDVTEMFLECISKTSISCHASQWRQFVTIIGQDQEIEKPILKKGMILKAIETVSKN